MVLVQVHLCHSVDLNCLLYGHLWECIVVSIPAKYIGTQTWPVGCRYPSLPLYNLLVDIPGHPVGSTVSLYTLWKEGYHPVEKEEM